MGRISSSSIRNITANISVDTLRSKYNFLINIYKLCLYVYCSVSILVRSLFPESKIEELGINNWPIWTCLFLDAEVTVTPEAGDAVRLGSGNLVGL